LAVAADRLLSAGQDGSIRLWDLSGNQLLTVANLPAPIWSLAYDARGRRLAISTTGGSIYLFK